MDPYRELADDIILAMRGPQRMVTRHVGVVQSIDLSSFTLYATLDGGTVAVGPLQYSGSVPPPNVGETWAFDVCQREWVAVYRLNAGPGQVPTYDAPGSAALAQANAQVHTDFRIDCTHSVPGPLPASTTLANCPAYPVFGTVKDATVLYLDLALATADSGSDGVEWDWYYNGTLFQTLIIPSGATYTAAEVPLNNPDGFGQPGDLIQGVLTYAGSTAATLTTRFQVP